MDVKDFFVKIGGWSEGDAEVVEKIINFIEDENIDIGKVLIVDYEALKSEILTNLAKYFYNILSKSCDVDIDDVTEVVESDYDDIVEKTKYEALKYVGSKVGCEVGGRETEQHFAEEQPENYIPPDFMNFTEEIYRRFVKK